MVINYIALYVFYLKCVQKYGIWATGDKYLDADD